MALRFLLVSCALLSSARAFSPVPIRSKDFCKSSHQQRLPIVPSSSKKHDSFTRRHNKESSTRRHLLPTCLATDVQKVAAGAGLIGLGSQLALQKIFRQSKDPVLKENAEYTAHTVVAFGLMMLVSTVGVMGWYFQPPAILESSGAVCRFLVPSSASRWLAAVISGCLFLWDIPSSLAIPALRKPDVIAHHIAMLLVAYTGATRLPTHYIAYYFGVIELSSLPLLIYDQLSVNRDTLSKLETNQEERLAKVTKQRDFFKIVAAVSFSLVRVMSFSKVSLCNFLPACRAALPQARRMGLGKVVRFSMMANVAFTVLQLYWFSVMVRKVRGGNDTDKSVEDGIGVSPR